jgi:hypothetical protein
MRDTETDGRVANEGARRATPAPSVTNATASSTDDGEQRRGAVRRPPSGESASRPAPRSEGGDRTAGRGGGNRVDTANRSSGRERNSDDVLPVDRAVPRSSVPPPDHIYYVYPRAYYTRYYDPWGYGAWGPGFAYYTPWGWGPAFYGSFGYGYGYGGYAGAYGYGGYGYDIGSVKVKVKPRDAEVYVDNYFAGYVDDFDGIFQALKVEAGGHRIEVRKPGFETLQFDVHVQPGRDVTFRGEMKPATP